MNLVAKDSKEPKMLTGMLSRKDPVAATPAGSGTPTSLTIRHAAPADDVALARLAELDSSRVPHGDVLVAEVGGEPWAALSLDDMHAVADPFRPSADLVFLLLDRARAVARAERRRERGGFGAPRLARSVLRF